jgi:Protein kinase domain/WD40-like Beta Propeller Repeat
MDADADEVTGSGGRQVVDWARLEPILDAVLDVDPNRRAGLLAELTQDDAALRAALRRLLEGDARPHPLLDRALVDSFAALLEDDLAPFPPSLAARFRGATEIGRGGMAVVFRARDTRHDRDVAVKVVRPELAESFGRERFLREIQVVAGLRHPHIIPLFDSGEADNTLYFVMPYEEGQSLRERLVGGGPLPIAETLVILRDVCEALAYAHRCGVVHRDIKPENILLSGGHALVADFGIALPRPSVSTSPTRFAGTPAYMPPEQLTANQAVDERTDIYAVGVVAYELLAGRRPFEARPTGDDPALHPANPPVELIVYREDVPPRLAQVIARCLRQRPEDRWQSADQMLNELLGIVARPVPAARLPARSFTPLAVGIAAVAVFGVAAWLILRTRNTGWQSPLANARIERLTDFAGAEVDAAISPDGRFVAFLAESSGVFDAYVTQLGSGRFHNLTSGVLPELFNEDVRNISFSANSSEIWLRSAGINATPSVSRMPTMGGPLRPFLDRAVMSVASPDGARIAYHEGGDDPIFVADAQGMSPRLIFSSAPGQHSHYLTWSPDGLFIYFAYGQPLEKMDIWRVPADSGSPMRITRHESKVSYPLLLDARTLLYVATDDDGTGPWLYAMDLDVRVARRLSSGVEHTLSLAAAAPVAGQSRRIVTTVANPSVTLWSIPLSVTVADEQVATPIAQVTTARARGPL